MDSKIEQLPDRTIVTTGEVETCFGSMKSAAEQVALLQTEIVQLKTVHKVQMKFKEDEIEELREEIEDLEEFWDEE